MFRPTIRYRNAPLLICNSSSFNPISTTSMNKVLTRILSMERQTLSKDQLNQVVTTSSGDIRTAINSLQFLLQKGN